ncbi:DivIVA domain-containing protein [Allobranchiibius sp. GilTou73]|uniref:DivIVA domain-containing protein n=1 Tax=Allobranchiibius sp. GilTou73 TaxID=2904523 RepID=UPI001F1A08F5|nr:DivIVA domain-containing protein [Allobranchiibius sp. GilTou73]UIJ35292.1 DivIVA domain-containing protein [Allobranchiibius sp. GilTou73]
MNTPWTSTHVDTVRAARLPRQRGGYSVEDVDRQLARIAILMRQQRPVPQVSTLALRRSRLREGYTPEAVEALLAHVAAWQHDFDLASPPPNPQQPTSTDDRSGRREWTGKQQDWVREICFARRTGTRAYDEGEVDAFLDQVLLAMAKGEELPRIETVRFYPPKRGRGGYDAIAVDVFLDQLGTIRPILR